MAFLLKLERGQPQGPTSGANLRDQPQGQPQGMSPMGIGRPIGSRGAERWMGLHFCGGAGPEWAFPLYVWLTDNSDLGSGELYLRMTSLLLRQWQSQTRETVEHVRSVRRERRFALPPSLSRQHIPTALIAGARQKRARRVELLCGCNLSLSLRHAAGWLCRRSRGAKRAETSAWVRSRADFGGARKQRLGEGCLVARRCLPAASLKRLWYTVGRCQMRHSSKVPP